MESGQTKAKSQADRGTAEPGEAISGTNITISLCAVCLLALAGAGYITSYVTITGGTIFYFVILAGLVINSAVDKNPTRRSLWLSLGLAPLIRIISLTVPQPELSEIAWFILVGIPVLVCTIAIMRLLKMDAYEVGINLKMPLVQAIMALTGIALAYIGYLIIRPEALNAGLNIQSTIFPALVLLVISGFTEELAFRGVMQKAAGKALGSTGWVYIALVYGVLQIGQVSLLQGAFVFLVALYFGWTVKSSGSITGVSLAHGLLNIGLFLIIPHIL